MIVFDNIGLEVILYIYYYNLKKLDVNFMLMISDGRNGMMLKVALVGAGGMGSVHLANWRK